MLLGTRTHELTFQIDGSLVARPSDRARRIAGPAFAILNAAIAARRAHPVRREPGRVLVALALNGVPIDVLAERLNTNRNALYKTLHDARRKLREHLSERGLALGTWLED